MNREESTSTTNDLEEGSLDDKSLALPSIGRPIPSPKPYVSQLRIWNGIYSQDNILKIFFRPFPFLLSPVVSHVSIEILKNLSCIPLLIALVCVLFVWNADRVLWWV